MSKTFTLALLSLCAFTARAQYCDPPGFTYEMEPICLVEFADIHNASAGVMHVDTLVHEDFTTITGHVERGATYTFSATGDSNGSWTNYYSVFVDWDGNGQWDEPGTDFGPVVGTTCADGPSVSGPLAIPADAQIGTTRMRVIKRFNVAAVNPCDDLNWGQSEDYLLEIFPFTGITEHGLRPIALYPVPAHDVVNIRMDATGATRLRVVDLLGHTALEQPLTPALDVSGLASGSYVLLVQATDGHTLARASFLKP